jgi:beta-glucosidase-like glycosyl hydrolase
MRTAGVAMASTIRGIQSAGVVACAKHFIANEQGRSRATSRPSLTLAEHFRQAGEAQQYGMI